MIGVSHAGRSSSTIRALDKARELGFLTIAMTAERERPITEHADCCVYIEIGMNLQDQRQRDILVLSQPSQCWDWNLQYRMRKLRRKKSRIWKNGCWDTSDQIPDIAERAWAWYRENAENLKKCRRLIVLGYESCMSAMLEGTLKILEASATA